MWWFQHGLCILPVALVVWSSATFIFAYVTAVLLRHVDPLFPFISDTGTVAPERCVFGLMLNISTFLGVATVFVRYKQVQALLGPEERQLQRWNLAGLVLGLISAFGMCIIANFQKTVIFYVHLTGVILSIVIGVCYILVQTVVSYRMQPHIHGKAIFWARLVIWLWTSASLISMLVSSVIMYSSLPGVDVARKVHWVPGEEGYTAHLVGSISEWSLAFSFLGFFLTYIRDFQKVNLRAEAVLESNTLYDSTHYNVRVHVHRGVGSLLLAGSI
ncbi:hypothetical protein MATL_G00109880 [Megalops atlanticus]|uniref:CWH43-like N-terminal domain-containing protein n=1 Tax=Megalops atlanticus TaxID=7932 RepID=A0A9D3T6M4_MEGAT|nr:hypothetical protein MATL_G00109880 [Megalops atlanticus]